jgi:hypothetical protein
MSLGVVGIVFRAVGLLFAHLGYLETFLVELLDGLWQFWYICKLVLVLCT